MYLINRKNRVHIGGKIFGGKEIYSYCNFRWYADDKVYGGTPEEITCKTCIKKFQKQQE